MDTKTDQIDNQEIINRLCEFICLQAEELERTQDAVDKCLYTVGKLLKALMRADKELRLSGKSRLSLMKELGVSEEIQELLATTRELDDPEGDPKWVN